MNTSIKSRSVSLKNIADFLGVETKLDLKISGITSDSRTIKPGDLFVALPGAKVHGATFIDSAVSAKASAVLTDEVGARLVAGKLPTLEFTNPRQILGELTSWFANSPSNSFDLYGVTGTNGKTTVCTLLNQLWKADNRITGQIGTLGIEIAGAKSKTAFTTPEADQLQKIFQEAREADVKSVAMEVSSIAIEMGRVKGSKFKLVAFTNLTQDHLDFHGNLASYAEAKRKLFNLEYAESAIVNIDDELGAKIYAQAQIPVQSYSISNKKADWFFERIEKQANQTSVAIRGSGGILIEGQTKLIGRHNLENLLLAVAMAVLSGVDALVVAAHIPNLIGASGRLEIVENRKGITALVDYAHTPDAVKNVLNAVQSESGKLIGVLGCGGDRDKSKRPLMGQELAKHCDIAIFTSDNPRSEDPETILDEMCSNLVLDDKRIRITDRREAIATAATFANSGDCIIVLGKGHEVGQEISGEINPFDDRVELAKAIEELA